MTGWRTYFARAADDTGPVKIGKSRNLHRRNWELTRDLKMKTRMLASIEGDQEKAFHTLLASSRIYGEWFDWTPEVEAAIDRINGIVQLFETGPARAAVGSFPYLHRTLAQIDPRPTPEAERAVAAA